MARRDLRIDAVLALSLFTEGEHAAYRVTSDPVPADAVLIGCTWSVEGGRQEVVLHIVSDAWDNPYPIDLVPIMAPAEAGNGLAG